MTNRKFHREHIVDVWNKLKNSIPLEGEERSLGEALGFHRELYPLFESLPAFGSGDIVIGGVNPILHITLHAVLENQLVEEDPKEVPEVLDKLMSSGLTRHEACHLILEQLIVEISALLRFHQLFDNERYRRNLRALITQPSGKKVGRNEPCPCGSGIKFKRCCGKEGAGPSFRTTPGAKPVHMLLGTGKYAAKKYLESCSDDDPLLFLENGSAVALALEELGNTEGAGLAYEQLVEYADKTNNRNYVHNALLDYLLFCINNKGWERKGIEMAERLEGSSTMEMEKIQYRLDAADIYVNMGNMERAEQMYQEIVDQNPESEWALLRWARYLVEIGRSNEAVEYYQRILKLSNKIDSWIISDAKNELAELI
ncbi:MAG: DUF1841 family protein [Bacillota bacterium]